MTEDFKYNSLIIKFLSQEISETEFEDFKVWLEKDPVNRRLFDEENELWQESHMRIKFDNFNKDKAWSVIKKQTKIGENSYRNTIILNKSRFRILVAAASITCLLAFGALTLWQYERKSNEPGEKVIATISTAEGEKARIILADSTRIIINSLSTVEYTDAYNIKDRVVKLSGEAYFDVKTNPEKPFTVLLGEMTLYATGTRFNVFSYENEDRIETTLEEGKMHIVVKDQEQIDIKAGQQIVYFPKTNKALIKDVPTETYTSWKENKLRFIDTPFEEVLRHLSRRYNVVFEVRNKNLLDLSYTATFIDESIEDVMQMLKAVSAIKYKIYKRATINDKEYLQPRIVIDCVKDNFNGIKKN